MTVACKICGAQFDTFRGLNGHMNAHLPRTHPHRMKKKSAEDFRPRTGRIITSGRKQKWIPYAIEYLKQWQVATAAEILPHLPHFRNSGTPSNTKALSSRLIRMPDIFSVDKTTRPTTFSLVETKEAESFGVEAYDESITVWICNACNRRYEEQSDAEDCCEGLEDYEVPYFDGRSKERREVHLHEAESSEYDGEVKMRYEYEIDDRHASSANISGEFVYAGRVWDFYGYADIEYDPDGSYLAGIYWEEAEIWPSDSELGNGTTLADFPDDQRGIMPWLQWEWLYGPDQEVMDRLVERFTAEFEQLSDASMAVSDRYDVNVGYIVASDGDDDEGDDEVTIRIMDDDFEPIAELELGQTWHDYNPDTEEYFYAEGGSPKLVELTVHVEVPDKSHTRSVSFHLPNHIVKNEDVIHMAIEDRLMDILQQPFGGWDLVSIKELEAESFSAEKITKCPDCDSQVQYKEGWIECPNEECEWIDADYPFWDVPETFEANFNPDQPRDADGRWVDSDESDFIKSDVIDIDLDNEELMALAAAIRKHDETFPDVEMLLEQIGDTAANRQLIFQEMLDVLSGTINDIMQENVSVETPEEYYQYILDEEVDDEIDRIYRQANYYAQFKSSAEIEEALEELFAQYQVAQEMGAERDIVDSIEKDINFVELVSRVQDMQRQYTAETIYVPSPTTVQKKADWNPRHPRVPASGGCKGGQCKKPGQCKSCEPGPGTGKGGGGSTGTRRGGVNIPKPTPTPDHSTDFWVNTQTGKTSRGLKRPSEQPQEYWRAVEKVPLSRLVFSAIHQRKQRYVDNILDEIVKLFPESAVLYKASNNPYIQIIDSRIDLSGLKIKGMKISQDSGVWTITYE